MEFKDKRGNIIDITKETIVTKRKSFYYYIVFDNDVLRQQPHGKYDFTPDIAREIAHHILKLIGDE